MYIVAGDARSLLDRYHHRLVRHRLRVDSRGTVGTVLFERSDRARDTAQNGTGSLRTSDGGRRRTVRTAHVGLDAATGRPRRAPRAGAGREEGGSEERARGQQRGRYPVRHDGDHTARGGVETYTRTRPKLAK